MVLHKDVEPDAPLAMEYSDNPVVDVRLEPVVGQDVVQARGAAPCIHLGMNGFQNRSMGARAVETTG